MTFFVAFQFPVDAEKDFITRIPCFPVKSVGRIRSNDCPKIGVHFYALAAGYYQVLSLKQSALKRVH